MRINMVFTDLENMFVYNKDEKKSPLLKANMSIKYCTTSDFTVSG